jgi:hypothetical protein
MSNVNTDEQFVEVIKTSKGAAYLRGLSDIPFAKEISKLIDAEAVHNQIMGDGAKEMEKYAPFVEARFKAINAQLATLVPSNIFELASGFSPRSLHYALGKNVTYIDTDLHPLIEEKKEIAINLVGNLTHNGITECFRCTTY